MNTAHDLLDQLRLDGAARFADAGLSRDHAGVARRVRRHRAVRTSVLSVAGLALVGAAAVTVAQLGAPETPPAATPSASAPAVESVAKWIIIDPGESAAQIVEDTAAAFDVS